MHEMSNTVFLGKYFLCMKCQILFSGESKKNVTNLSTAELAHKRVAVCHNLTKMDTFSGGRWGWVVMGRGGWGGEGEWGGGGEGYPVEIICLPSETKFLF